MLKKLFLMIDFEYIKLGYLHDVIVVSKDSEFASKQLYIENLEK